MARPPRPTAKRYRGRIRSDIRSALRHLTLLINWDSKYHSQPIASYPNQLASTSDMANVAIAAGILGVWLGQKGPIPSR